MNNKQWMVTPTFIDFNLNELHHCLFIISMELCYGDELMNWFCGMVNQWKTLIQLEPLPEILTIANL